jgi:uncharacterized protein YggE
MKRHLAPIIILACSLMLAGCAAPDRAATTRTLSVTGSGSVTIQPDIATVTLGIQTSGPNVAAAGSENNSKSSALRNALTAAGIAADDIRTAAFTVTPQQQYDPTGNPTGAVNYWVDNSVLVTVRDLPKLGSTLDAAIGAGANQIQGISFSLEDSSQAESQARQKAFDAAKHEAELLAKTAGATLGKPLTITTNFYWPTPQPFVSAAAEAPIGGGVPVASGSQEIQAEVSIVFELR